MLASAIRPAAHAPLGTEARVAIAPDLREARLLGAAAAAVRGVIPRQSIAQAIRQRQGALASILNEVA